MAMAEWEAAVAALEAGVALDPASVEMVSWCGAGLLMSGGTQPDQAVQRSSYQHHVLL